MPTFRFTGGDARDYFAAEIGHVEPGEERQFDEAPDANWVPVDDVTPAPVDDVDPVDAPE